MRLATRGRLVTVIAAAGLVLSACGGSTATPAPTAAPSAAVTAAPVVTDAPGTLPAPEQTSIKIGMSVTSELSQYAVKLAEQAGLLKQYGFTNVEIIGFEGDGKAVQAMLAGQVDFITAGSSSVINSRLTDTPFKVIAMNSILINDGLFCTKDIKTAADVKGKTVAVSTFGGTSHGSVLLSLKALGYTAADVVITEVGGQSARIAALQGGSIGCAPVDASMKADMEALGLNMLTNLVESGLAWGRSGLVSTDEYLAKNPNTALVLAAASLEAQNMLWTAPDEAAKYFAEFAQIDVADAAKLVKNFPLTGDRTMMWTADAFLAPKEVLSTVQPEMANVDVTTAYDQSFLQKLVDIGFYAKIGVPLP